MYKLIVIADRLRETEIYEVTNMNDLHKISQLRLPQESVEFIKNYSNSLQEEVDVTYIGPKSYVQYFITQVNNLEFAKAHRDAED